MADSVVVVNSALCFLKNNFGKVNVKLLKSALLDFYDVEVVSGSKIQSVTAPNSAIVGFSPGMCGMSVVMGKILIKEPNLNSNRAGSS